MMPPLRILIVTPTALPAISGNAMTVERWRRSLVGMGHAVRIFASQAADRKELFREIAEFRPDIIHAHHAVKSGALLLGQSFGAVAEGIPFVVSPAGTDINQGWLPEGAAGGGLEPFLAVCRAAGGIVVQSPWVMSRIGDLLPGVKDRLSLVPKAFLWQGEDPVDLMGWPDGRSDTFLFFVPAGIRPVKGNLECLRWLEAVHRARPAVRVVFAGPAIDAAYAAQFGKEIGRLSAFARWIPGIPPSSMRSAYRAVDAVLNASLSEGLSNTLLEAIASGRPILASDIPGNRWPILGDQSDTPCGCLFDRRNPDDFIEKAIRLADDEGLRREFAETCRRRSAGLPGPGEEAEGLERAYRAALRPGGASPAQPAHSEPPAHS